MVVPLRSAARVNFGDLICLRWYFNPKITSSHVRKSREKSSKKKKEKRHSCESLSPPFFFNCVYLRGILLSNKMADSGKMLEVSPHRVVPVQTQSKPKQVHYPFWFGGSASCFAASVTHPLDLGMCLISSLNYILYADFAPTVKVIAS